MGGYTAKGKGLPLAGCLRIAANGSGLCSWASRLNCWQTTAADG